MTTTPSLSDRVREPAELPGPRGLPFLGMAPKIDHQQFHSQLEDWYRQYGGTYSFFLGPKRYIVFGDLESSREVLKGRPQIFFRGKRMTEVLKELGGEGLFTAEGDDWRRQRRLTTSGFSQRQLQNFFPHLLEIAQRLRAVLERASESPAPWDFRGDFERFTTDVTTSIAFGHDVNSLEGGRDLLQADMEQVFPAVNRRMAAAFPLWRYIKLPKERRVEAAARRLRGKLEPFITRARERLERDPEGVHPDRTETILEAMIAAEMLDEDKESFSPGEVYGNVLTLMLAGEDTTAHTLAWIAHAMVSQPEIQDKLQAELDRVLGDAPGLTAFDDQIHLPYLNGVIQEALRLRSVAPMMFHQVYETTQVADVRVEPGQVVVVLTRHCAVQEEHFSEAQRFWPERWMRGDEATTSGCPVHQPKAMMPFGSGPRICPGRGLALLELNVAIASLCRNFHVEALDDPAQVQECFEFTMRPRGFKLGLKKRR